MLAAVHPEPHGIDALSVCLHRENSNRLVSLWDIVNQFDLREFARINGLLSFNMASAEASQSVTVQTGPLAALFRDLVKFCKTCDFDTCRDIAAVTADRLSRKDTEFRAVIAEQARNIETLLSRDMYDRKFLWIASTRSAFVDNDSLFGEPVRNAFPSAREDIRQAGNSFAVGSSTAAVFHLMRVAEYGLRALAKRLRVSVTHKGRAVPLQLADWEKIITAIKNKIAAVRILPAGIKRQQQLELYSDAGDHCTFMKDIWRNNVSHTRKPYTDKESEAALERVRAFMLFLAQSLLRPTVH